MKLPRGRLVRKRVCEDPGTVLERVFETELTGYARLEPPEALLLEGDGVGVLTFEEGIPHVAYHTGSDRGGPPALGDLATGGPYGLELFELRAEVLSELHVAEDLLVPPGLPADRLAGDPDLAERTRRRAPDRAGLTATASLDPVEAFLEDEDKIAAIQERAREEAERRAAEWGFD